MNRAYSLLELKSIDEEKRIIEGVATTPTPDRYNDVVEPEGMEYKLPLPLLYQHNSRQPIGNVTAAKVQKDGITIKAQIAPMGIATFIDEAWSLIKAGLVRGLSIGFRPIEEAFDRETGGYHYLRSEWLELSAVTIPAQAEATITSVKSADALLLAASGNRQSSAVRIGKTSTSPGVAGPTGRNPVTIKEQITQFEAKVAASDARLEELITKAATEGRTFDDAEQEEHDTLTAEIRKVTKHIALLKDREKDLVAKAVAIEPTRVATPEAAAAVRGRQVVQVNDLTPKGIGLARAAIALMACKGNRYEAAEQAKKHWPDQGTELELILKTEQLPGTTTGTTWALPLIQSSSRLVGEFIEMLRPATIIGRVPNLRFVPFNITVPVQTGGGTYGWVGENLAKPVSGLSLTTAVLRWAKVAGIIPFTKESMRFSDPSIETVVRNDMIAGMARYLDTQFVDPAVHESANVSPASITDQIVNTAASGLLAADFIADMSNIIGKMLTNNQDPADLVILMSTAIALNLSSKRNSLGQRSFPDINVSGGNYNGIPIITSQNVGARVILFNPNQILIAQDPGVTIDVSEEASVVMTTTPQSSPAASELVSFWQNNLIGLRVEQFVTWKRAIDAAVEYISGASYSGTT